jgi:GDPmannose 4,6-dehydratase
MKKALVVGHTGQDGFYITELLKNKGYAVTGVSSSSISSASPVAKAPVDIADFGQVSALIQKLEPDEVYYLAAVHQSSSDRAIEEGELFQKSISTNISAFVHFLESIRLHSRQTKIFYAASSHVFGNTNSRMQDENTALAPDCIYGITKAAGLNSARYYRSAHKLFASAGILYNHESPRRASKYVSKKIVETAVAIKRGEKSQLVLGNLDAMIDWGYAPDYMEAAWRILQSDRAEDFIISSGELHSVNDFVSAVFDYLGLDSEAYVTVNPELITKSRKKTLFGNNNKLITETGWSTSVNFLQLVKTLVDAELSQNKSA